MGARAGLVVVDASGVIALHAIGRLELLARVYADIVVPAAVWGDVGGLATPPAPAAVALASLSGVRIQTPTRLPPVPASLDPGEREAIALALETRATHVLLDERAGRRAASALRVPVAGTLALLLRAKQIGALPAVAPEIARLRATGFHLSDELVRRVLAAAGEP